MTLLSYVKGLWTALLPAATKAKMENIEDGIKAASDVLDLETDAGRAITQAADAAAQRALLEVDSSTEVTAKADAAQAAAEATAAGALAGHVAAADPHTQYQKKEAGKGLSTEDYSTAEKSKLSGVEAGADVTDEANVTAIAVATDEVTAAPAHWWVLVAGALKRMTHAGWTALVLAATGKTNAATGYALAGGTTNKTLTVSADADSKDIPTADEKTRLGDIQGATGATTALKLANLTSPATPTQQGVALLGASGGAAKLTAMPDGATAVYAYNSAWATYGFSVYQGTISYPSADIIRCTYASGAIFNLASPTLSSGVDYKTVVLRARANRAATVNYLKDGSTVVKPLSLTTDWQIFVIILPAGVTHAKFVYTSAASGDWFEINWLWIGDYSLLDGSMLLESARVANELAVTQGVGVAASGTITATDQPTATKGDTIGGKKYTYVAALTASPGVEGEVLIGSDKEDTLENLNLAISEVSRTNNGVKYWAAAVHPLVSSAHTVGAASITLTAKTTGLAGNQITVVSESGTNHTASGSTLTGGKDAVGEKIRTQVENYIAASGTRPAAARIDITNTALVGYEDEVDKAVGATLTFPAGGTWIWFVHGYGANVGGQKKGSSAGGATITMAGANGSIWYRKYS